MGDAWSVSESTLTAVGRSSETESHGDLLCPALVVTWSAEAPERIGESVTLPHLAREDVVIGRGVRAPRLRASRALFAPARPGQYGEATPVANRRISRDQLLLSCEFGQVHLRNIGKAALRVNDRVVSEAALNSGDVVDIGHDLQLLFVRRQRLPRISVGDFPFGCADAHGIVGESAVVWQLRREIAQAASRAKHTLVTGASGTGKELVARSLHATGSRSNRVFVSRNAATLPSSLIDAELFGNAANYPNGGMPARPGLVGQAHGGTLFLDEVGEVPHASLAHLLRLLDSGEYHRLGDGLPRHADLVIIAASNRAKGELKHDFLARFPVQLHVPTLDERREDIPLLARHLLTQSHRDLARPFLFEHAGKPMARVSQRLSRALLRHPLGANVRELERLLLLALDDSPDGEILLSAAMASEFEVSMSDSQASSERTPASESGSVDAKQLQAALDANNGVLERTWRALGLRNRHELRRLIRRHGLIVRRRPE
jgi:transcriptional regulator with AAA-type ATPase domain